MDFIIQEPFDIDYQTDQHHREDLDDSAAAERDLDMWTIDQLIERWGIEAIAHRLKIAAIGDGSQFKFTYQSEAELNTIHSTGYTDGDEIANYQEIF